MMIFMKKIFNVTTLVSIYMQSPKLDLIEAMTLVDSFQKRLEELKNNCKYNEIIDDVKSL